MCELVPYTFGHFSNNYHNRRNEFRLGGASGIQLTATRKDIRDIWPIVRAKGGNG
jgi:hypothetical protein